MTKIIRSEMKIIKSEEAISEVLGTVLILSITILVISTIMSVGGPMIESGKQKAKTDVVANSFLSLQNDIEEVVRGPIWVTDPNGVNNINGIGPSRETELELMGGSISVMSNSANATCLPNCSVNNVTIVIPSSNITYVSDNDVIVYENGAVIRKYESGESLMISDPLIDIYNTVDNGTAGNSNITISMHLITINGTLSSVGGEGKSWTDIRLLNYTPVIESSDSGSPNYNKTVIQIYSKYPEAWSAFFDSKLKGAGLDSSKGDYNILAGYPLSVTINGTNHNSNSNDIYLSIYESRIDTEVKS